MRIALLALLCSGALHSAALSDTLDISKDCILCPEMIELPVGRLGVPSLNTLRRQLQGGSQEPNFQGVRARGASRGALFVDLDAPFAISIDPVTNEEWSQCIDAGKCPRRQTRIGQEFVPDAPANFISYADILEYVAWLNESADSSNYRLPTEAEWLFAGQLGVFHLDDREVSEAMAESDTAPRFQFIVDPEFTMSCYTSKFPDFTDATAFVNSGSANCAQRVILGVQYVGRDGRIVAAAYSRGSYGARVRSSNYGFRVVKEIGQLE